MTEEAAVQVNVETEPEETPAPDVTVIDTGGDGGSNGAVEAVVVEAAIDHAARLAELEAENERLRAEVAEAQSTAETAEVLAEIAIEEPAVAEEPMVPAETVEQVLDEVVPDEVPDQKPWWMKSWRELRGKTD